MIQSTIQSFGNVDRIEVLRGPQGTLRGRNATGGAINVVTRDPGPEREASIDAEYGDYNHGRFSLYASEPLFDWLALAVAGFYDRTDAYYEQLNPTGPEILDQQNWGVRPKLAFTPGKIFDFVDVKMVLSGYILDHEGADTNVVNQFDPTPLAELLGASATPEPFKASSNLPQTNYVNIHGVNFGDDARLRLARRPRSPPTRTSRTQASSTTTARPATPRASVRCPAFRSRSRRRFSSSRTARDRSAGSTGSPAPTT